MALGPRVKRLCWVWGFGDRYSKAAAESAPVSASVPESESASVSVSESVTVSESVSESESESDAALTWEVSNLELGLQTRVR